MLGNWKAVVQMLGVGGPMNVANPPEGIPVPSGVPRTLGVHCITSHPPATAVDGRRKP
jgi:hypothetical protein